MTDLITSRLLQHFRPRTLGWPLAWLLTLIQLIAVLIVVANQPTAFHWFSWRDFPGIALFLIAVTLQLAVISLEANDVQNPVSSTRKQVRLWRGLYTLPLLTWIALWGHQSVVAQCLCGLGLILLGIAIWSAESNMQRFKLWVQEMTTRERSWNATAAVHAQQAAVNEPLSRAAPSDRHCQQTWRRNRTGPQDTIEGQVKFVMSPGQRTGWYHLPIWPFFEHPPQVTLSPPKGSASGSVKVTQVEVYGIRLELKLDRVSELAEEMSVDFHIEGTPMEQRPRVTTPGKDIPSPKG